LLLGENGLVSWTYDSPTNSWQSNVDIQPKVSTVNLGNVFNPWNAVYANSIITPSFTTTSVVANVANIGVLNVITSANISSLTVDTNANIVGDLQVNGNSTIINVSAISSNVSTLILDKDNSTGILADGSGIQIGLPAIGTFLYNYATTSWQSSIDITPAGNTIANLGNINNRWFNVYTLDVETTNVNSININTANVFSELMYANTIYASANVYSDLLFGNVLFATSIVGNIITAAQPNITSVGVLTNLSVAGNINANTVNSNVVTANTATLSN
jgi:hypothetical protein